MMAVEAVSVVLVSFVGLLAFGPQLTGGLGLLGVLVAEVVLVGAPAWIWIAYRRRETEALGKRPTALMLIAGVALGVAVGGAMVWLETHLLSRWVPVAPDHFPRGPFAAELLALALAPAACEELLFRGALMSAIRSRPLAVVTAAVAFGAFHASPSKFAPAALLGLVLGVVRLRAGSLWAAVAFHAANNTLVLVLSQRG